MVLSSFTGGEYIIYDVTLFMAHSTRGVSSSAAADSESLRLIYRRQLTGAQSLCSGSFITTLVVILLMAKLCCLVRVVKYNHYMHVQVFLVLYDCYCTQLHLLNMRVVRYKQHH